MAFMKSFHFVLFSLIIYSCLEDKIGAEVPALKENVNSVSEHKRNIVILNEELSSFRELLKARTETKTGKAESSYTVDDEDGEFEEKTDLGSGDEYPVQSDEPVASSDDGDKNVNVSSSNTEPKLNSSSTRVSDKTLATATAEVIKTSTTTSLWATSSLVTTTRIILGNTSSVVSTTATGTPVLITSHASPDVLNTIRIDASVFTSETSSVRPSVLSTRGTRASTVAAMSSSSVGPTENVSTTQQPKTIETTTKESNDVLNQKDPLPKEKEKKTLFGFVTIEILVALLAGAACAVILLIFLVHRLKKRNEGSYELKETLMLKSGGYAEEKEVFV